MNKTLVLDFFSDEDNYGISTYEEISGETDQGTSVTYRVHDLSDCPEDAILGRDLFSAYEFIETLKLGMKLAQEGYTEIVINEKCVDE